MENEVTEADKVKAADILDELPVDYVGTGDGSNVATDERDALNLVATAFATERAAERARIAQAIRDLKVNFVPVNTILEAIAPKKEFGHEQK